MKNIRLYPDIQAAIGTKEKTDFLATVPKVHKVMSAALKQYGSMIEIEQEGEDFIRPKEPDLFLHAIEDGTITFKRADTADTYTPVNMQYRINLGEWQNCLFTADDNLFTCDISAGQMISFKGDAASLATGTSNYSYFTSTCKMNVGGNIMSLINYNNSMENYCFYGLFKNCTNLISAETLKLPMMELSDYCYAQMFSGCTGLVTAPVLPAKTLMTHCYNSMFYGCTSLIAAPELPATTLSPGSYYEMFSGCTSIVSAPVIPADVIPGSCCYRMFGNCTSLVYVPDLHMTTIEGSGCVSMFEGCTSLVNPPAIYTKNMDNRQCCQSMFEGCTSLIAAPELPATKMVIYCYHSMFAGCTSLVTAPSILPATELDYYCYQYMFSGCTSLTTAPVLPATELASHCYYNMFSGCTSLTTAPELPAETLVAYCYSYMFSGCTNLSYIKAMFTTTPNTNTRYSYTNYWVQNVAAEGTFVKNNAAAWTTTGVHGVPEGWNVVTE